MGKLEVVRRSAQDNNRDQPELLSIIAVSYTHLDVYKRQIHSTWKKLLCTSRDEATHIVNEHTITINGYFIIVLTHLRIFRFNFFHII